MVFTFTVSVPNSMATEVLDYFVKSNGYVDVINGVANPETKGQAAQRYIVEYVKARYRSYKVALDTLNASNASNSVVDNLNITS